MQERMMYLKEYQKLKQDWLKVVKILIILGQLLSIAMKTTKKTRLRKSWFQREAFQLEDIKMVKILREQIQMGNTK